jgi:hypothetical protein
MMSSSIALISFDLRFFPLEGNANYDWRWLGELIPALRSFAFPRDFTLTYVKHLVGDHISDQYRGMKRIIDEETVDLRNSRSILSKEHT